MEVPVKPVCPNDPTGSSSPRFDENAVSMSQPSPRSAVMPSGVAGRVILSTASGDRMRVPFQVPRASNIRTKIARSSAVPNRPAWPATPPIRLAVGSCTTPRSIGAVGSHGQDSMSQFWVGAIRDCRDAGGRNPVSRIPSGPKTCPAVYRSRRFPVSCSTM